MLRRTFLILTLLGTVGCSDEQTPDELSEASEARQEGCVPVPPVTLEYLADALADDGITLSHARAFMSPEWYEGRSFYYVGAEVDAPGYEGDDDIGIWTAFDLHGGSDSGPTMAVGPVARQAGTLGTDSRAPIVAPSHPGVAEVTRCVRDAIRGQPR